jgi:hypothetical protein
MEKHQQKRCQQVQLAAIRCRSARTRAPDLLQTHQRERESSFQYSLLLYVPSKVRRQLTGTLEEQLAALRRHAFDVREILAAPDGRRLAAKDNTSDVEWFQVLATRGDGAPLHNA